jgi:hypothetical protein
MTGRVGVAAGRAVSEQEVRDMEIEREFAQGAPQQPEKVVRVVVVQPYKVTHNGTDYRPGDTAEVPESVAQKWIANGWVHEHKRRNK